MAKKSSKANPARITKKAAKAIPAREPAVEDPTLATRHTQIANQADAYERRKARERERQASQARAGADIGEIPAVVDPKQRERVSKSLLAFCKEIFPRRFGLDFSKDHLEVIGTIQRCIDEGQLYTLAMPRGSGKTTIIECAVMWAIATGRRRYIAIIGADKPAAKSILTSIKSELEVNDNLLDCFPEMVFPIRKLEGKQNKANGQTINGERTHIEWKGLRIVIPTVKGSLASAAIIECVGILGRVRGMNFTRPDGDKARPDFFVLDDPQTDRSAQYTGQVNQRLNIITGAVLGLAGPDTDIAGFATVTVIRKDDVADQLLDRQRFPDWQGKRYRLVYKWPTNTKLWDEYGILRAEGLRVDGNVQRAVDFYLANRNAMDKGYQVAWEARKKKDVSAIQHAYNLRFQSPQTFDAEFQNEPLVDSLEVELLTAIAIEKKIHGYERGVLPTEANLVTGFIDVQGKLLYYCMVAWETSSFTGWIMDYGCWPQQNSNYYTLRSVDHSLAKVYPKMRIEARWRKGLFDLVDRLSTQTYSSPAAKVAGVEAKTHSLRAQFIGIDAAYGPSTKTVEAVAMEHPKSAWLMASFGQGIDAAALPMDMWKEKRGERKGDHWFLRPSNGGGVHCLGDSNYWKSFVHAGFNTPIGDPGSISLFKPRLQTEHRMFGEHLRAESPIPMSARGRTIDKWVLPPNRPDNHMLDCLYGSAIMASILGAKLKDDKVRKVVRSQPRRRQTKLII
jgi:energy-coupling factor transporter ATP-binding protein EcfA2